MGLMDLRQVNLPILYKDGIICGWKVLVTETMPTTYLGSFPQSA